MNLITRWDDLKKQTPHLRIRDAADQLGVSEAELLATGLGTTVTRLDRDAAGLLHALPTVGRCMALTRNSSCVNEVKGTYDGVELGPHAGQVVGDGIDLRVFVGTWQHIFAVNEADPTKEGARRRSIHVFDNAGTAIHKVYLQHEGGNVDAWDALVAKHTADLPLVIESAPPAPTELPDDAVDVTGLHEAWDAMQDTHEFFLLLRKFKVTRTQALRLAGPTRARQVATTSMRELLEAAALSHDKIMIFVGNRGCIQIFSGAVANIKIMGPWLNVLDPGFNLHLRADHIVTSWVVSKPTKSGTVTSLELFDAAGETIALVFRKRDDRELAEDPAWSALLAKLSPLGATA
ncbi:MAG TPA: ChuX/HutX family heme-like substrate-binding protein [Kofleriaceae bacterium]